ncbi:helix-turn-helix domain-containing protein [Streptococcus sp. zg-86]|uniref:Helix-turn-helix domain-containing protein n=1 Tax=Streptococcus zhangguiae TaxID=2664091 RepID=A0A6I4RE93_9STRE|nr:MULTISPECIES: helix-turn-helix transcriptional regulator [unclassified Streptococcus]MTB63842.1 helix-turn-helix domain-containing protein [Streptococcus sp. zg-86]MTB90152.1 helix-turn-helix domain-containing protein [Streptococcus sp. zg-36]MWV55824.1 helix-turn-helix domain-containing protein [Streptococcus sp. zg-70]QTH47893.1 helix-turn-helix transcriptional regulator [Streptococcus sp. zg-86]
MLINRLAILLAERSMSGVRLASDTGIAQSTISKITSNKSKQVDYETVNKICNILGVTSDDFFDYSPIDYEIKYFRDEDSEDTFIFIKILDRDRPVATLEYKVDFEFHVNTNKPDNLVDIEEIKRNYQQVEIVTVRATLKKQNKETYDKFTELPSNFQNIFTNDLLQVVGKNIKEYITQEFKDEFIFAKNSSGHVEQLLNENIQILVSSKIDDCKYELPF